jgi:hypothetical protein
MGYPVQNEVEMQMLQAEEDLHENVFDVRILQDDIIIFDQILLKKFIRYNTYIRCRYMRKIKQFTSKSVSIKSKTSWMLVFCPITSKRVITLS